MAIHPKEQRIILKYADEPGFTPDIDCYMKNGGYEMLKKAVGMEKQAICDEVKNSQLRGRGGAGFPAGVKWSFVDRKSGKPIYMVCNCDESEPGTFKDRQIVHKDPHQLIEGIIISCFATDCAKAFIYIREEMPKGAEILNQAIKEAKEKNLVGDDILGSGYSCDIVVHRGAAAYICGEETGLIESLEGKRANPRIKPPYFPAVLGLYMCPTIVNNVETLCNVVHILRMGADEFSKIGRPNNTGTRIWCVSGGVKRPGYYEVAGITLGELVYDICGGPKDGRTIKAVIPGGSSMKILKNGERFTGKDRDGNDYDWGIEDIPLDYDGIAAAGSMSGSGGMMVLDDSVEIPVALANLMAFYSHESCGQCTPCREGSLWLKKITTRMVHGQARPEDVDLMKSVADQIEGRTICAFGFAVAWPVQSYLAKFEDEFREFTERHSRIDGDRTAAKELACNH